MRDRYLRCGQAFIVVYAINSTQSFADVPRMLNQLLLVHDVDSLDELPVVILGNKSDLAHERKVLAAEGQELADVKHCAFMEGSAKDDINIDRAFYKVVRMWLDLHGSTLEPTTQQKKKKKKMKGDGRCVLC